MYLKVWVTITKFLRVPAQVVIYGSWFLVLLFVLAHGIDSSELYLCIIKSFVALDGKIDTTLGHLYFLSTMLTCHMHNVWVLCVAVKFALFISEKNVQLHCGLLGIRGYLFPFVSLISISFDIKSNSAHNVDILSIRPILSSVDTAILHHQEIPSSGYQVSGILSDIKNLALSFIVIRVILVLISIRSVQCYTQVPYCILAFCNHTMFSTSWKTLLFSLTKNVIKPTHRQITHKSEHLLMNILGGPRVYCYCQKTTGMRIHHLRAIHELEQIEFGGLKKDYDCEQSVKFNSLSWRERIECL
ncbi:hypothetical protein THRCLA_10685 [Thraustotheca clavata]|uniref:Transmembrane protein n=1 Tax=Thraustotheca clavata TaxID=74557 RepID=A0A1V9YII0_9STRA|nr:hypothetical protein THRCLA_10685 [Thraustotheca clavata]